MLIKLLMEYKGLSRLVFGKTNISEVLLDNGVIEPKSDKVEFQNKTKTTEQRLKEKIKLQEKTIKQLRKEKEGLQKECELLMGSMFLVLKKT